MKKLSIHRMKGLTLIELLVTVTIITLLIAIGLPAFRALRNSFESGDAVEGMISGALASARAMAVQKQQYVGLRFQEDLDGHQYMIFIEHDRDATVLSPGFKAVAGVKPIRLPDAIRVTDGVVRTDYGPDEENAESLEDRDITAGDLDNVSENLESYGMSTNLRNKYLVDTSSFSVVFSHTSGLVGREVRARNYQGIYRPDRNECLDHVFNSPVSIAAGVGQFIQDDYAHLGLGAEMSRHSFVVYNKRTFDRLENGQARFDYLDNLPRMSINRYTGTLVGQPMP